MNIEYGFVTIKYSDSQEIPSIVMGAGNVGVTDILINEQGQVGIGFYSAPENTQVGEDIHSEFKGNPVTDLDIKNQLLFDNPQSIDVVIARLKAAKESLIGSLGRA